MLETSKNTLEELEIRQLKNRRGVCKRKLTVFNKFIERIDSSALTAEIIVDISLRLEQLPKLYNDFSEIQDRIETLCSDEGDIEAHEAERMSFEDTFYRLSAKGKLLAKVDTDSTPNDHIPQAPPQQPLGESIKYPEISLPSFDGDLTQWLQFRDTFDALVNQASLAPIVKYKYLRSCLQDGALEVISSLDFSEDAYMLAWQMLCERYNNPKRLVTNHMRALFDVEPVPSTPSGLRGLCDNISKHLRSLRSLNVPTENWDLAIIHMLVKKLDSRLQSKWENSVDLRKLPSLQDFKTFLKNRADRLEATSPAVPSDAPSTSKKAMGSSQPISWRRCDDSSPGEVNRRSWTSGGAGHVTTSERCRNARSGGARAAQASQSTPSSWYETSVCRPAGGGWARSSRRSRAGMASPGWPSSEPPEGTSNARSITFVHYLLRVKSYK
ncbi:uncharacterized protein LOC134744487 isoform X7 [Cydia strobilella]|uniref:uncharacterized protein LOC134744487 isoform X7 n=3 Tax=Cydia strobilella TaxID=1100964 RepID=UPI0030054D02